LEAARNDRVVAQDRFLHGREPEALCYLARALGYAPGCTAAAELAVSMLNPRYAAIARWFLSSANERPPRPGNE